MTRLSDAELLSRYARDGSNAAFEALVRRHIDSVYAIATRQVGGDTHLAKDVAQLVFTAAARKAAFLADRAVLGGWLCRTTQFVARDVVRAERRRRAREEKAHAMESIDRTTAPTANPAELRRQLDPAIAELSSADRDAIWLRFFEGNSFAQVGAKLRLTENAARMRVDRALGRLRLQLSRRGITSTAVVVGELLADPAVGSAPEGFAAAISSRVSAQPSPEFFNLLHLMTSTQLAVAVAGGLAAMATAGLLAQRSVNGHLRAEQTALHQQLAGAGLSQAQSRQLKQALAESDKELGTLLAAVGRLHFSASSAEGPAGPSGPQLTIIGAVRRPGLIALTDEPGATLSAVIALAGGFTDLADARHVVLNHRNDDGTIEKQTINVRALIQGQGTEPKLRPRDVVVVFERTI